MSFIQFQQLIVHKIGTASNYGNFEIFACIASNDFMKKNLKLSEDSDIRWLFRLISNEIEKY